MYVRGDHGAIPSSKHVGQVQDDLLDSAGAVTLTPWRLEGLC